MTIDEILKLSQKKGDIYDFFSVINKFDFFSDYGIYDHLIENFEDIKQIEIFTLFSKMTDHRRGHWIKLIKYRGENVLLTFNAGREGDDFKNFKILDKKLLDSMMSYIQSLIPTPEYEDISEYEMNKFYGMDLDKELMDINLTLKFKKGDIISFPYKINGEMVDLKAEILETDNKTRNITYKLVALDYVYSFDMKDNKIYPSYSVFNIPEHWHKIDRLGGIREIFKKERKFVTFDAQYADEKNMKKVL